MFSKEFRYSMLDRALGTGAIPDSTLRFASRRAAAARTRQEERGGVEGQEERLKEIVARMSYGPIAEQVDAANEQHYEIPSEFFELFLGPRRKYSSAIWSKGQTSLTAAEEEMLGLTCSRAGLRNGMRILELGCGWGSLSFWMATQYPDCEITPVSNSSTQKVTIDREAERLGIDNLTVITADVNYFELEDRWAMSGIRYAKTLAAWLERLDANLDEALKILETVYDKKAARRALGTWRLFLVSTEQIWLWDGGNDWMVSHYLFAPRT